MYRLREALTPEAKAALIAERAEHVERIRIIDQILDSEKPPVMGYERPLEELNKRPAPAPGSKVGEYTRRDATHDLGTKADTQI